MYAKVDLCNPIVGMLVKQIDIISEILIREEEEWHCIVVYLSVRFSGLRTSSRIPILILILCMLSLNNLLIENHLGRVVLVEVIDMSLQS